MYKDQLSELSEINGVLSVGYVFPLFATSAVVAGKITTMNSETVQGKWFVVNFIPQAFTPICGTEIEQHVTFEDHFKKKNTEVLFVTIDNPYALKNWLVQFPNLKYPVLSDLKRDLSFQCGVLDQKEGVPLRATFIVDPDFIVQYAVVSSLSVGRNADETLRVLSALQSGGLCKAKWTEGEDFCKI